MRRNCGPMPKDKWPRSHRTGKPICYRCRRGYGSEFDGLCLNCRPSGSGFRSQLGAENG